MKIGDILLNSYLATTTIVSYALFIIAITGVVLGILSLIGTYHHLHFWNLSHLGKLGSWCLFGGSLGAIPLTLTLCPILLNLPLIIIVSAIKRKK